MLWLLRLTWTVGGLPGAAVRTAAGERAPDGGEDQQDQQAAGPEKPAHRSHDGVRGMGVGVDRGLQRETNTGPERPQGDQKSPFPSVDAAA